MSSKHILYIHPSNELYGADRSLLRLVRNLDPSKYRVSVLISSDIEYPQNQLSTELAKSNITVSSIPMAVIRRRYFNLRGLLALSVCLLRSVWQLTRLIRSQNVDIVHTNSSVVLSGAIAAAIARRPHVWHVREIYTSPKLLGKAMAIIISILSKQVVAVSIPVRQQLVDDGCSAEKIEVVHNGIDLESFGPNPETRRQTRSELNLDQSRFTVGMVGRISSWKGQEVVVRAAKYVLAQQPDVQFVLAGGVVEWEAFRRDKLLSLIAQLEVAEHVHVLDFRKDVPSLLTAFDLFILPSILPDPYPTVVLEAMASGLPVIGTNHGGVTEMITDSCGLLVEPNNPELLANSIIELASNRARTSQMGHAARQRALTYFSTETYAQSIHQLYQQIR